MFRKIIIRILAGFGALSILLIGISAWIIISYFWGPKAFEINDYHPFRSERTKEKYLSFYDAKAKNWPGDFEERIVSTSYGKTFVRVNGSLDSPPLVLLPGGGATSLMWKDNIEKFSEEYRTYAIDNIYDFGKSIYQKRMGCPEHLTKWLNELFLALELGDSITLVGYSYGSWIISQYLVSYPENIKAAVLACPAYTVYNGNKEFEKRVFRGFIPLRYFMRKELYWSCNDLVQTKSGRVIAKEILEGNRLAIRCFKTKIPASMTVLTDEELRNIKIPVLYIAGENERMYSVEGAVERLKRVSPEIQTVVVPNAGHCLIFMNPEILNTHILDFLRGI